MCKHYEKMHFAKPACVRKDMNTSMDTNKKKSGSQAFAAVLLFLAAALGALELALYIKDGRTSFDPN